MKNNILALVITITLGIILTGSLLMPAVEDANKSFTEEASNTLGAYRVDTANVPITFSFNDDGYTLNGELIEADYTVSNQMLILSDKFVIATNGLNTTKTIYIAYTGHAYATASSVTWEDGHLKYGTTDVDLGYTWIAYPSNSGNYMFAGNLTSVNVDEGQDVYVGYMGPLYKSGGGQVSSMVAGRGAVGELVPNCYTGSTYTSTPGNVAIDYEPGTPYDTVDTGFTLSADVEGTIYSATNHNVFVPITYHVIKEDSKDAFNLLAVLPILVIVGLVLAGVSAVRFKD